MRSRIPLAACVVLAVLVGSSAFGTNTARATVTGQDTSTLDDQVELSLTVYNSDIALVRDVRNVELAPGTFDLRFMDIAATVNPATVHFRSLTEPPRVHVLEQNYEYDLLEPDKLLRKYVGRDVTLVRQDAGSGHDARGGGDGAAPQLQQRAGLADRQRDRHRPAGRSHPVPRAARQPVHPSDADLDARQPGRRASIASRRRISRASCPGTPTTC